MQFDLLHITLSLPSLPISFTCMPMCAAWLYDPYLSCDCEEAPQTLVRCPLLSGPQNGGGRGDLKRQEEGEQ